MQGCSKNVSSGQLVVGFSQIGSESDWRRAHTKNIQDEARKRGIKLMFSDAQQKQENQIKAIKNFIAQKVDVIILAPVITSGWEPVLREAKAAKIPVILSDRTVDVSDDSLWVTHVGPNLTEEGRMAGEWLAKKMNGKANIVELTGTASSAPARDRKIGFQNAIKNFPGMKIIKSQTGDFKRVTGQQVMEAFIASEGKNIQAVYAHNDDMALGAIQALEAAGIKPGKDVIIVSIDGVKAAFEAMIAGKLNCSVECNPLMGPALFDACEKAVKGIAQPKEMPSKEQCFDQSVAAKLIGSRKY
ncbi:MAG: ABC transporter substrate-binding protein [Armatimonadetes bacterium]|nr:ABC transporter substrate-binding protein [Armatimonadota bacterium]